MFGWGSEQQLASDIDDILCGIESNYRLAPAIRMNAHDLLDTINHVQSGEWSVDFVRNRWTAGDIVVTRPVAKMVYNQLEPGQISTLESIFPDWSRKCGICY